MNALNLVLDADQEPMISMSAAHKEAWLTALRSGEYKQGINSLCNINVETGNASYCCLGVLQKVISGEVEKFEDGTSKGLPSIDWLRDNGIQFGKRVNNPTTTASLPMPTVGWYQNHGISCDGSLFGESASCAGLTVSIVASDNVTSSDVMPGSSMSLVTLNDDQRFSFEWIADIIEREAEAY
jgi:hypothetical protein